MLITKFNKMIKSKVVLIALAFIIVLAFVGLPVASQMMNKGGKPGMEGELFGEDVSSNEFRLGRYFELRFRHDVSLTPEENDYLRDRVWKRLAALRFAHSLGINSSNEEIAAFLQKDSSFADNNGQFSSRRFREILQRMKISEASYEEYMRQELVLRKLQDAMSSTMWVPHSEARDKAASLTDEFTAEYVHISSESAGKKISVKDDDALAYFEKNKEYFKTEKAINLRYIEFPAADHFTEVKVTDKTIEDFYYSNIDDYSTINTNDVSVPTPLDEVKEEITQALTLKEALNSAAVKAFELVEAMSPQRHSNGKSMIDAASTFNAVIRTSAFFSASELVPGIDAGYDFNTVAFALNPEDTEHYFSDPIIGTSNVYVIATLNSIEPIIPEFKSVKDKVIPLVKEELQIARMYETAKSAKETFETKMKDGKSFQDIAKKLKLTVTTTDPFNAYEGMTSNNQEYAEFIIPAIMQMEEGEVSDIIDLDDGVLIASISSRSPADALTVQAMKPQVASMIERYRGSLVYEDWMIANLKTANHVDSMADNLKRIQTQESDDSSESSE